MADQTLLAVVHVLRCEAQDIVSIELRPTDETVVFPPVEPGAHIDLHLENNLVRSYSLINTGESHRYVVAVQKDSDGRGGSLWIHEHLRIGQRITISRPRNHFALNETAPSYVLVAGGIGITPLLAMLQRLVQLGKPTHLIYCTRSRSRTAFLDQIGELKARQPPFTKLRLHISEEVGKSADMLKMLSGFDPQTHFYCCGPARMMDAFETVTRQLGYAHCYTERFKGKLIEMPAHTISYEVELKRSGKKITVPPGVPLLDLLLETGVAPPLSCREGVCGTCETTVLDGEVEHHDSILSHSERTANKSMMVCVSNGKCGVLVLDL